MEYQERLKRLERPHGRIDVVLDTDAYNEIDDQFALAYLLSAPERLRVQALYAAPFQNDKADRPGEGMEKSYDEILHILDLAGQNDLKRRVFRGSTGYLPDERTPVDSPAARDLAERAMAYSPEHPLYVAAIGAITNVASALLMRPEIGSRIVVVWLGGHAWHWHDTHEFNMMQDVAAARVVFGSDAALVQLPCMGVVSAFATTGPELRHWLLGKNPLCDYLVQHTEDEARTYAEGKPWSRTIWDVTAIGWLLDAEGTRVLDRIEHTPIPQYDHHYSFDPARPPMRYVYHIDRDALFCDLFARVAQMA